ncbi:MAG: hypothetical protein WA919_04630 [Coleofasciculaceae cyanobacterium]
MLERLLLAITITFSLYITVGYKLHESPLSSAALPVIPEQTAN